MTVMIKEVYDAFIAAGAPEDKATAAAEAMSRGERRFSEIHQEFGKVDARFNVVDGKIVLLLGMVGFAITLKIAALGAVVSIAFKLFH